MIQIAHCTQSAVKRKIHSLDYPTGILFQVFLISRISAEYPIVVFVHGSIYSSHVTLVSNWGHLPNRVQPQVISLSSPRAELLRVTYAKKASSVWTILPSFLGF